MQSFGAALTLGVLIAAVPSVADACRRPATLDIDHVRYADVVAIGRITDYRIVLDQQARRERRRLLESSPTFGGDLRETLEKQTEFLSDYASFEFSVDDVLHGKPGRKLRVKWNNSTFAEPESLRPGPYLIALDVAGAGEEMIGRTTQEYRLLQEPCAPPFLFEVGSEHALAIQRHHAQNDLTADQSKSAELTKDEAKLDVNSVPSNQGTDRQFHPRVGVLGVGIAAITTILLIGFLVRTRKRAGRDSTAE